MRYVNFVGFDDLRRSLCGRVAVYGNGKRAKNLISQYLAGNPQITELFAVADRKTRGLVDNTATDVMGRKEYCGSGNMVVGVAGQKSRSVTDCLALSDGTEIPVYAPECLQQERDPLTILLTEEERLPVLIRNLKAMNLPDSVSYTIPIREYMSAAYCGEGSHTPPPQMAGHSIPKKIHCFWFSGEKKPERYQKCLDSWRRVMPDYEIVEWDKENWDVEQTAFTKSAAEKGAWAFVSDYARLDVIWRYGGIYLDLDVQVLRRFDDLLHCGAFWAYDADGNIDLGSGFGAEKGNALVRDLLCSYDGKIYTSYADYNQPAFLRPVFQSHGFEMNGNFQILCGIPGGISADTVVYPRSRFTPYDSIAHICYADMSDTYSIHLFHSGWLSDERISRRDSRYDRYQAVIDEIGREEFERASREAIDHNQPFLPFA